MRQIFLYLAILNAFRMPMAHAVDLKLPTGVDAIYGLDDREFITKNSDPRLQKMSRSIGYIVSADKLERGFFKTQILATSLKKLVNLCSGEKFEDNQATSNCTGFLVASDVMATAGHCFATEEDCSTKKIIFDVDSNSQTKKGFSVAHGNIYSCARIISQNIDGETDYALIQLDRAPRNRLPLKLNLSKRIEDNEKVFMLGHPFGLPLIISKKTKITDNSSPILFKATLDSFEGNSGSPVINAKTFQVEGILVNGQEDLVQDSENLCYRNAKHVTGGEGVLRSSSLPTF